MFILITFSYFTYFKSFSKYFAYHILLLHFILALIFMIMHLFTCVAYLGNITSLKPIYIYFHNTLHFSFLHELNLLFPFLSSSPSLLLHSLQTYTFKILLSSSSYHHLRSSLASDKAFNLSFTYFTLLSYFILKLILLYFLYLFLCLYFLYKFFFYVFYLSFSFSIYTSFFLLFHLFLYYFLILFLDFVRHLNVILISKNLICHHSFYTMRCRQRQSNVIFYDPDIPLTPFINSSYLSSFKHAWHVYLLLTFVF